MPKNSPASQKATSELFKALYAHQTGRSEVDLVRKVERYLAQGADVDEQRPNPNDPAWSWHTPLSLALSRGLERCALAMIPLCDPLTISRQAKGGDLLMNATWSAAAVEALLKRGADPWRRCDQGRSALLYSLRFAPWPEHDGVRESVGLLLEVSDAGAVDHNGLGARQWLAQAYPKDAPAWVAVELAAIEARLLRQSCPSGLLDSKAPPRL